MRREVESLLAQDVSRTGALDGHALDLVTSEIASESLVGRQLGGYEFCSLIDEGGMGQVYRARDLTLPRDVAVKVVSPEFAHDAVRRQRFRKEAEILAGFAHPHIAHVYAFVEAEGRFLLAMELVPGRDARRAHCARATANRRSPRHRAAGGRRPRRRTSAGRRSSRSETRKHPDHARRCRQGPGFRPGQRQARLPRLSDRPTLGQTAPGTLLGTVAYMSPEQARGERVDKRTDIWAFGCVLFEMLTGRRLFDSTSAADTLALVMTRENRLEPVAHPTATRGGRVTQAMSASVTPESDWETWPRSVSRWKTSQARADRGLQRHQAWNGPRGLSPAWRYWSPSCSRRLSMLCRGRVRRSRCACR